MGWFKTLPRPSPFETECSPSQLKDFLDPRLGNDHQGPEFACKALCFKRGEEVRSGCKHFSDLCDRSNWRGKFTRWFTSSQPVERVHQGCQPRPEARES
jgi:hypothetical protein